MVAGYFLDEAYGGEWCFTGEKAFKTAVRFPPVSWIPRKREREAEGRGVEDRRESLHLSQHMCTVNVVTESVLFLNVILHVDLAKSWAWQI